MHRITPGFLDSPLKTASLGLRACIFKVQQQGCNTSTHFQQHIVLSIPVDICLNKLADEAVNASAVRIFKTLRGTNCRSLFLEGSI